MLRLAPRRNLVATQPDPVSFITNDTSPRYSSAGLRVDGAAEAYLSMQTTVPISRGDVESASSEPDRCVMKSS